MTPVLGNSVEELSQKVWTACPINFIESIDDNQVIQFGRILTSSGLGGSPRSNKEVLKLLANALIDGIEMAGLLRASANALHS